jgi:hypothetical protein
MRRLCALGFLTLLPLALGACGEEGTGPLPFLERVEVIQGDPSHARVIQEIFNRRGCAASACHGSTQKAGLDLRAGNSWASLVNVPSTQVSVARVIPGNPVDSYLMVKVEGRQSVGERMPKGWPPLDDIDLANLRNWIAQGAKGN